MRRALELARRGEGRTRPNPPVGAVVVREGKVVGEGFHPGAGQPHAEIFALAQAGELARGADLYVTLEPCCHQGRTGPCTEAVIDAGVGTVFIGTTDPNPKVAGQGIARLKEAGIEVAAGLLEKECRRLIAPFAKHVTTGIPYLILKTAVTLDGKTATESGDSQWISNEACRAHVHELRNRVDAVMVGIGTVLRDDPRLNTRLQEGGRDAARIVVDSRLRIPEDAALLNLSSSAPSIIVTSPLAPPAKIELLRKRGVHVLEVPSSDDLVDLREMMKRLGDLGFQSILLEGGSILNRSALEAGIIDRMMVFMAPVVVGGGDAKGIFAGVGVSRIADARRLQDVRFRRFGDNILIEGEVPPCSPD